MTPPSTQPPLSTCLALALAGLGLSTLDQATASPPEAVPNRIVVLTFDDSVKSHFTVVRPILKEFGFGATFFITEGFDFRSNKRDYMTWEEIAQLHRDGFEIGNHTRDHMAVTQENLPRLAEQIEAIASRCQQYGIPRPVSFAYPGNAFHTDAIKVLHQAGIQWARRGTEPEYPYKPGHGLPYEIGLDHPLLIPTAGDARPAWSIDDFVQACSRGKHGRIAVLQFHGVPDRAHPWVHTDPQRFRAWMRYLKQEKYTVIALRDLERYVAAGSEPTDPEFVMRDRKTRIARQQPLYEVRPPKSPDEARKWFTIMQRHGFGPSEMAAATGQSPETLANRWTGRNDRPSPLAGEARPSTTIEVLPYPGGRHPRRGFRDGAIRPQRETKVTVFLPWDRQSYVVLDIPEAIWMETESGGRELLYLAHTHVPTLWDKRGIHLEEREWEPTGNGGWKMTRKLPNGVEFGTLVEPDADAVRLSMWLKNGSSETLKGLRVQCCAMLAHARGFDQQTNDNKTFRKPVAGVHDPRKERWIYFEWNPCVRAWGNTRVPCLHSDPQFPDCPPGQTRTLAGRLWFSAPSKQATTAEQPERAGR